MTEKKTNVITINDKEYDLDSMSDGEKILIAHVQDLDRKIASSQFNLDQLNVGKAAFIQRLVEQLESSEDDKKAA